MAEYGPKVRIDRRCSDCPACVSESYRCQSDSGSDVYCEHPSLGERKRIGDTTWSTPDWCPALSAQQPEAVAWTVVGPDGKTSIGGWHDMSSYEVMSKWGVLRDGHRYAYAYEGVQPQAAVSDAAVLRAARVIAKRVGEDFDNIGEFAQSIILETQREAITAALRPDAES